MIIHLAIPAINLDESMDFYLKLGAKLGRKSPSWAIFNLCGMQLVLHKSEKVDAEPSMYPRHFGVILNTVEKFLICRHLAETNELKFFEYCFSRFTGEKSEHKTFFLCDPSNNLIEFKWYLNQECIFGDA